MAIDTSREAVERILENVTPGPWHVDGPLWNQIIWASSDNRVCFMAHNSGLDDARDLATAAFIAAARGLVPALLAERDAALAEVARLSTPPDDAVALAKRWESYGYPDCSGDCASANPPVSCCIMRETYDVSRAHAAHRKE